MDPEDTEITNLSFWKPVVGSCGDLKKNEARQLKSNRSIGGGVLWEKQSEVVVHIDTYDIVRKVDEVMWNEYRKLGKKL